MGGNEWRIEKEQLQTAIKMVDIHLCAFEFCT